MASLLETRRAKQKLANPGGTDPTAPIGSTTNPGQPGPYQPLPTTPSLPQDNRSTVQMPPNNNSEGPGGFSGRGQDPNYGFGFNGGAGAGAGADSGSGLPYNNDNYKPPPAGETADTGYWAGNQWVHTGSAEEAARNRQQQIDNANQPYVPPAETPSTPSTDNNFAKWSASVNTSRYDPALVKQFYDIFSAASGGKRLPRQDEIDQWLGGYLAKDDINGAGQVIKAWAPGSQIDPYWAWRITGHAQGDYNGDNPGYLGEGDLNSNRAKHTDTSAQIPGSSSSSSFTPGGPTTSSLPPGLSNPNNALYQQMIAQLLNTPQTVDAESLQNTPEAQAQRLASQRAEERGRAQIAERLAAQGVPTSSGAMDTDIAALRQQRAEGDTNFIGQLAVTKMQQNRESLVQGIQFAMQDGQFDKAQALQLQLADLDAALKREGMALTASEGNANRDISRLQLGYNYDALQAQLNQQALLAALQG